MGAVKYYKTLPVIQQKLLIMMVGLLLQGRRGNRDNTVMNFCFTPSKLKVLPLIGDGSD